MTVTLIFENIIVIRKMSIHDDDRICSLIKWVNERYTTEKLQELYINDKKITINKNTTKIA